MSKRYSQEWYKNSMNIGIKKKLKKGKKQVFSFGGKRCGLGEQQQRGFGYMVLRKLDEGQSERTVKDWVRHAVGQEE